jgi:hypothetical protein
LVEDGGGVSPQRKEGQYEVVSTGKNDSWLGKASSRLKKDVQSTTRNRCGCLNYKLPSDFTWRPSRIQSLSFNTPRPGARQLNTQCPIGRSKPPVKGLQPHRFGITRVAAALPQRQARSIDARLKYYVSIGERVEPHP